MVVLVGHVNPSSTFTVPTKSVLESYLVVTRLTVYLFDTVSPI
jgi:hypothetical protein